MGHDLSIQVSLSVYPRPSITRSPSNADKVPKGIAADMATRCELMILGGVPEIQNVRSCLRRVVGDFSFHRGLPRNRGESTTPSNRCRVRGHTDPSPERNTTYGC